MSNSIRYDQLLAVLNELAPLDLAAEWDNVGLLIDTQRTSFKKLLLTIDLTEPVIDEAIRKKADFVMAYHPPIFQPLTQICSDVPVQRVVQKAIRADIAVYSPHTALDAATGGVNDWLADGLGKGTREVIEMHPYDDAVGQGRRVTLDKAVGLSTFLGRVKKHLGMAKLRVAHGGSKGQTIKTIALCAGAGGSVIGAEDVDLLLTGEMSHHHVLAAAGRGVTVVLSEHTHTERGYLPVLKRHLKRELPKNVAVEIARSDADPIQWV